MDTTSAVTAGPAGTRSTAEPVLAVHGITKAYRRGIWPVRRRRQVLRGVDLTLNAGEVVGLVGENGSGKSTLMKVIVGALAADDGTVTRSGRIGYCPQEPVLYGRLTCDEHFELYGHAYGMSPAAMRDARAEIYAALGFERYARTRADHQKFWGLVAARRAGGRAVLIVSHFVVDEQRFDRIVAIRDGKGVPR